MLLRQVWYRTNERQNDPRNFAPDTTDEDVSEILIVIAVLFATEHLNADRCIEHFKSHGLTDAKLPITKEQIIRLHDHSDVKQDFTTKAEFEKLASAFVDKQWRFCAIRLQLNMHTELTQNHIVPICKRANIKTGSTAQVSQIVVQKEFVHEALRQKFGSDKHSFYTDELFGPVSISSMVLVYVTEQSLVLPVCSKDFYSRQEAGISGRKGRLQWAPRSRRNDQLSGYFQPRSNCSRAIDWWRS